MTRVWPPALAIREGLATTLASSWQGAIRVATTAGVVITAGLGNAIDVAALASSEKRWIDDGGYVLVVEPGPDQMGGIAASACDRLTSIDGIDGAFAVSTTDLVATASSAPGSRASLTRVSPGIYGFFNIEAAEGARIIATPGVVGQTGLTTGESSQITAAALDGSLTLEAAMVRVTVVDSPVLAEGIAGAYLSADLLQGDANQCYVRTGAAHHETLRGYLETSLGGDGPALVRPRLSTDTHGVNFETAYADRPLRWAWLAGALVLTAIWGIVGHTRRTHAAIYATFGVHAKARLVMNMTEWLAVSGVGTVWGWSIALTFSIGQGVDPGTALPQVTFQALALWCCFGIGATLISLWPVGTLLDALKERA